MHKMWERLPYVVSMICIASLVAAANMVQAQVDTNQRDVRQSESDRGTDDRRADARDEVESRDGDRNREERRENRREREESQAESRTDRDADEARDQRSGDGSRRAPERGERQSNENPDSDEQGGLGVAVVDDERGVRVVRVYGNTPAQEMGLRPGDYLTHVDGREVESARGFISLIRNMEPGEEVELDIVRNQDERSVSGELESRSEALVLRRGQGEADSTSSFEGRDRGDTLDRLYAIERQLDQLRRELQQLKTSLQRPGGGDFGEPTTRESAVIYYDDQSGAGPARYPTRQTQYGGRSTPFDGNQEGGRSRRVNDDRSPGGVTGEGRLRVDSERDW
jgi:PDZ domain